MDSYHSVELLNRCHKLTDIFAYLTQRKSWILKHVLELDITTLSSYLIPEDKNCFGHAFNPLKKEHILYNQKEWSDNYRCFYKCTGCNLVNRLRRLYPDLTLVEEKYEHTRGISTKKDKIMILPPLQTNVLINWYLSAHLPPELSKNITKNWLTFNCGERSFSIRSKSLPLSSLVLTPELFSNLINDIYLLASHLAGIAWWSFNPEQLYITDKCLQLSDFSHCSINISGQQINKAASSTPVLKYSTYFKVVEYPSSDQLVLQNFYLYLFSLLNHKNIFQFFKSQPELIRWFKNLFRPSEVNEIWLLLENNEGKIDFIKDISSKFFLSVKVN